MLRTRLEREHFTSSVDKCRKTSLGLAWDVSFKLPFNGHFINEIKGTTLPEITEREFCYQDVLEALWFRQSQELPRQRGPDLYRDAMLVHGWHTNVSRLHKQPVAQTGCESRHLS